MTRRSVLLGALATAVVAVARWGWAQQTPASFGGSMAGEEREVEAIKLCWCPPGRFIAEAEGFCRKLTERGHASRVLPTAWEFRLPSEAQWEYACRAGTTTATAFGDRLSGKQANFRGKPYNGAEPGPSVNRAARVGSYPANAWGLHDMHGNIYEWCRDWYHAPPPGGADPDLRDVRGAPNRDGTYSRVRRGGAWVDDGWACRSANRLRYEPERRCDHIGFRVVVVQA